MGGGARSGGLDWIGGGGMRAGGRGRRGTSTKRGFGRWGGVQDSEGWLRLESKSRPFVRTFQGAGFRSPNHRFGSGSKPTRREADKEWLFNLAEGNHVAASFFPPPQKKRKRKRKRKRRYPGCRALFRRASLAASKQLV